VAARFGIGAAIAFSKTGQEARDQTELGDGADFRFFSCTEPLFSKTNGHISAGSGTYGVKGS
jgi:hypothetical protein